MLARSTVIALLALAGTTAAAQDVKFAYAPGTAKYKVTSNTKQAQEAMGQKQEFEVSAEQRLTLTTSGRGEAVNFSLRLDTLVVNATGPTPPLDLTKIVGATYAGTMNEQGKVSKGDITVPNGGDAAAPQFQGLKRFVPALRPGLKIGSTWSDSSTNSFQQAGAQVNNTTISNFRIERDTTIGGEAAWIVSYTSDAKINGKGNQQGADFVIDGTGKGTGMHFLGKKGTYLGRTDTEESNMTVTVEAAGLVIPIVTASQTKVELVK